MPFTFLSRCAVAALLLSFLPAAALAFTSQKDKCLKGETEERISTCTALIEREPDPLMKAAYHIARGKAYVEKRDCDRGISDLDIAVQTWRSADALTSAITLHSRGNAWAQCGDIDKALSDYQTGLANCPGECEGLIGEIAWVWAEKGDYQRAIAEFDKAIAIGMRKGKVANKNRAASIANRGLVYVRLADYDRALADFDEAQRVDPSNHYVYPNRAELLLQKGDVRGALGEMDKGIKQDPKSFFKLVYRCRTLRYLGELDRAMKDCDRAIEYNDDFPPAHSERGLVFEKKGDLERAKADFNRALSLTGRGMSPWDLANARDTARARLAALGAGVPMPVIPAVPGKAESASALPTPTISLPAAALVGAPVERRVALVIGNSEYAIGRLPNPPNDAETISELLKRLGFATVTLVKDTRRESLVDALRTFANEAEQADWALVYYAGHGVEIGGENYLVPVDAKLATDRDVQFEAVPLVQVLASIEQAKKLRLVFLDACRDNPFASGMRRTAVSDPVPIEGGGGGGPVTRSMGRGLGRLTLGSQGGMLVFYSAKHGLTALDGEGANSPFAVAVAQRLATPGVEINKLLRLIRDDVMEATAGRQEPYTYGTLPGREEFFFVAGR